jgi:hypothetical protein
MVVTTTATANAQAGNGAAKAEVICALANAHGTFRCDDIELATPP